MILLQVAFNTFIRTWFRIRLLTSARQACQKIAVLSLIGSQRQSPWHVKDCIAAEFIIWWIDVWYIQWNGRTIVIISAFWSLMAKFIRPHANFHGDDTRLSEVYFHSVSYIAWNVVFLCTITPLDNTLVTIKYNFDVCTSYQYTHQSNARTNMYLW